LARIYCLYLYTPPIMEITAAAAPTIDVTIAIISVDERLEWPPPETVFGVVALPVSVDPGLFVVADPDGKATSTE
jgi:hypothetical protein